MSIGAIASEELKASHGYVCELLDGLEPELWFRQPAEGITHVAWQVGHLAMAAFRLGCCRLRGERPEDEQIMSAAFLKTFGRGSTPAADPAQYPSPAELTAFFDRVHQLALAEIALHSDDDLALPQIGAPHPYFTTKQGALFWCARHEMLHAGKIGLLKRLFGQSPKW